MLLEQIQTLEIPTHCQCSYSDNPAIGQCNPHTYILHAFLFISNLSSSSVLKIALLESKFEYLKLLSNCLAFYSWRFFSYNTMSKIFVQQLSLVSCIQKCARILISTVTHFSIADARFSLTIGSLQQFSNCLAFLDPVLELL